FRESHFNQTCSVGGEPGLAGVLAGVDRDVCWIELAATGQELDLGFLAHGLTEKNLDDGGVQAVRQIASALTASQKCRLLAPWCDRTEKTTQLVNGVLDAPGCIAYVASGLADFGYFLSQMSVGYPRARMGSEARRGLRSRTLEGFDFNESCVRPQFSMAGPELDNAAFVEREAAAARLGAGLDGRGQALHSRELTRFNLD